MSNTDLHYKPILNGDAQLLRGKIWPRKEHLADREIAK